jgi:hypothetical protein
VLTSHPHAPPSQGVFLDADGSLLSPASLAAGAAAPNASYAGWGLPAAGASFHSDVENGLFDARACAYLGAVSGARARACGA